MSMSVVAPKQSLGFWFFFNCHGCQTFILSEIYCYLSTLKRWHNNLFLSGVFNLSLALNYYVEFWCNSVSQSLPHWLFLCCFLWIFSRQDLFQMKIENHVYFILYFSSVGRTYFSRMWKSYIYIQVQSEFPWNGIGGALEIFCNVGTLDNAFRAQKDKLIFPSKHSDCVSTRISSLMVEN